MITLFTWGEFALWRSFYNISKVRKHVYDWWQAELFCKNWCISSLKTLHVWDL
jgi:hypothetical protein